MAQESTSAAVYGLSEANVSSSGEVELENYEEVHQNFQDVALILGDRINMGMGGLIITNRRVIWCGGQDRKQALAAAFQNITLHAMAQADEIYQKPCIYMQLESPESEEAAEEGGEDGNEGSNELSPELRLVPMDSSTLQGLFQAMCECAALNPDADMEEEGEEDDSDEGFFYDEEAALEGSGPEARAEMLSHLDSLLQMPRADELDNLLAEDPGRFADAEDEEDEEKPGPPNGLSKS